MRQYRAETRKPSKEAAELSWDIGAGFVRTAKATVQDMSPSGMGLLVATPFNVGVTLQITIGTRKHAAVVKRCIKQGSQHLLGVKFER
jgi:hypothetical protein